NLFGPDGMLYVGMGDGGSGGDPMRNAQSNSSHLAKLLRFDVSTLPATPEHFAKGLRNPWRYAFDRATGDLYIADVGQNLFEEIDFVPAASLTSGLNYGWTIMDGLDARGELYVVHWGSGSDGAVYEIVPGP